MSTVSPCRAIFSRSTVLPVMGSSSSTLYVKMRCLIVRSAMRFLLAQAGELDDREVVVREEQRPHACLDPREFGHPGRTLPRRLGPQRLLDPHLTDLAGRDRVCSPGR